MQSFRSFSSTETKKFAENLAQRLVRLHTKGRGALVIALRGELGSGKTTFVQGFLRGLGVRKRSASPTFIIFRRFALRHKRFAHVFHVDVYRIKKPNELMQMGFREILGNHRNIVLIEWADKTKRILPKGVIWLRFQYGKSKNVRTIKNNDPKT